MTASTISQPLNNVQLLPQSGGSFVAKTQAQFTGGDALIGISASAWSQNPGPISMLVWLDNQPTGAVLGTYASAGQMHLALGHTWVWCRGVSAGQHTLMLEAGPTTVTDQNDWACATIIEVGDGLVVHASEDAPCPKGVAQPLLSIDAETGDGGLWMSGSSSGWVTQANTLVGSSILYDGGDGANMQVFANNANQHLAVVPTDNIQDNSRGNHQFQIFGSQSATDLTDYAHLTVVEFVDYDQAPSYRAQIQNQPAQAQHGDGGQIASLPFSCSGGPLMVRVGVSCWTQATGVPLVVGIQVDGTSKGFTQIYANVATTHMPMITNDLVITGVPAGNHTLGLIGELNTITDQNDRVSILIFEF
jgi:hypothetical protein